MPGRFPAHTHRAPRPAAGEMVCRAAKPRLERDQLFPGQVAHRTRTDIEHDAPFLDITHRDMHGIALGIDQQIGRESLSTSHSYSARMR